MTENAITEDVFQSAVSIVQNMPKEGEIGISNTEKLHFYALFKQATIGQCRNPRPSIWKIVERYKWDAWTALGNLQSEKAKDEYVFKLRTVLDKLFERHDITELMKDQHWAKIRSIVEPDFENIGRPLAKKKASEQGAVKWSLQQPKTDAALSMDDEYADASDLLIPANANSSVGTSAITPNNASTNCFETKVVACFQATTQVVLQQIQTLNNTLQKQNAVIQKFIDFMKTKQSNPMSWSFILLLFIWPICVQLTIRYFFRQNLSCI